MSDDYGHLVVRHEIDEIHAGKPPFDHYFTMTVPGNNEITIEENQDLSCFSIRERGAYEDSDQEDLIHICDADTFMEALRHFQRLRAQDQRYEDHPDRAKYLGEGRHAEENGQ